MEILTIALRMFVTFLFSLLIGIERQRSHKPVGFGTFIFVALGASALGVFANINYPANEVALLASVVTGIGFLGAGALIKGSDKVFGFTTAATIWLFAIFGFMIGVGDYVLGLTIYTLVWVVLISDKYLETKEIGSHQKKLTLVTNNIIDEEKINKLLDYTKRRKVLSISINKEINEMQLSYLVQGTKEDLNKMLIDLFKQKWLKSSKIE
ncbi:MgtC/SapB family protein [Candidatus Woesearchaeota archaeon]|nr:MgtC/SapB family protein [Candidatus Woesearchaeota archaeon]